MTWLGVKNFRALRSLFCLLVCLGLFVPRVSAAEINWQRLDSETMGAQVAFETTQDEIFLTATSSETLVYLSYDSMSDKESLFSVSLQGGQPPVLISHPDDERINKFILSDSGSFVVYSTHTNGLRVAALDGSQNIRIDDPTNPFFGTPNFFVSDNGAKVVYESAAGLVSKNPHGADKQVITSPANYGDLSVAHIMSDGSSLIYVTQHLSEFHRKAMLAPLNGDTQIDLSDQLVEPFIINVIVSNDESRAVIVFDGPDAIFSNLFAVDIDGGNPSLIGPSATTEGGARFVSLLKDSDVLVFQYRLNSSADFNYHALNIDGTAFRQVSNFTDGANRLCGFLLPNAHNEIIYCAFNSVAPDDRYFYRSNVDTGVTTNLHSMQPLLFGRDPSARLSPDHKFILYTDKYRSSENPSLNTFIVSVIDIEATGLTQVANYPEVNGSFCGFDDILAQYSTELEMVIHCGFEMDLTSVLFVSNLAQTKTVKLHDESLVSPDLVYFEIYHSIGYLVLMVHDGTLNMRGLYSISMSEVAQAIEAEDSLCVVIPAANNKVVSVCL